MLVTSLFWISFILWLGAVVYEFLVSTATKKSFFWKFYVCLAPCIWAGWVTFGAVGNYVAGNPSPPRVKLGVDLEGGTILVYEIDRKKLADGEKNQASRSNMANLLAEALKRRIDPNDLYNIVIRPSGEDRVEIILPTGGVYRTQKAEAAWNSLLELLKEKFVLKELNVGRGKSDELADRIQYLKSQEQWQKIYDKKPAWDELLKSAYDIKTGEWKELKPEVVKPVLEKIKPGDFTALVTVLQAELTKVGTTQSENEVKGWIKRQAWRHMEEQALEKWPFLKPYKTDLFRIQPDNHDQFAMFVSCGGNLYSQGVVSSLTPVLGLDLVTLSDAKDQPVTRKEIVDFVTTEYGPSLSEIRKEISKDKTGYGLDLTVEEVQRIKELVSKVGSLEFVILANDVDDKAGIAAAEAYFKDAKNLEEITELMNSGTPPPGPREESAEGAKKLKFFHLNLPHGNKSTVSYRWVELGPQERKSLGLDNASETERGERNYAWRDAEKLRKDGQAGILNGGDKKPLLQGALFYSRPSKNRNMPDEERRAKKFDYFVLARNPEIDPADPLGERETPKIDGSFLVSAVSGQSSDFRPAVHFQFNTEGGRLFGELTRKNVPSEGGSKTSQERRYLSIILDGLAVSAATIQTQITTNGQISGSFTQKEVDNLVNILRSGALPASLNPQPVSENTMGPTLGFDTIVKGVQAIVLAFAAVLVFMILYYRFSGLVASVALLANLLLTIGFMIGVQATFTLPGLAGLVLMLGMAVDANVLIYERIREERDKGASLALAIRNGYDRAFPTIIDTHLSSIFTAIVLYVVGNDQLRGFGVSLTVGLVISLFTSLYMTRLLFDFWLSRKWLHKLSMFRFLSKPNIDFMGVRNYMFAATITLAVLGIGLFVGRLPNDLNIDFVGGTAFGGQLTHAVDMNELRGLIDEKNQKEHLAGVLVKEIPGTDGKGYELTYPGEKARTITLTMAPAGEKPEDSAANVANLTQRASNFPDPAVEQIYPSDPPQPYPQSAFFTIRTSEKEPELVQAMLDRLLMKDGKPLLKRTFVELEEPQGQQAALRYGFKFSDEKKEKVYASPSFFKTLLARHLTAAFGKGNAPDFELQGEKDSSEGRFKEMTFVVKADVALKLNPQQKNKVREAVEKATNEFIVRPQPDRLENFDSQLANETRYRAMWAIIASWGAILLYLWFRFGSWTFGLAAVICLIHDLFFTLGAIAGCHFIDNTFFGNMLGVEDFKIDLPAVAALLTLVGYSVNDTIVVFDRIREVRGKNPDLTAKTINDSINQTLSRTLLTSLVTWLVVIVLYIWGGPGVHLFAFVMVVGVIVGTYSSIYIASPLLLMFGEGGRHEETPGRPVSPKELETGIQV